MVRQGASTGGLDIPPLIMQKKFGIPVGISLYVCDFTVLVMQAFFSTSDQVLYGILNVVPFLHGGQLCDGHGREKSTASGDL